MSLERKIREKIEKYKMVAALLLYGGFWSAPNRRPEPQQYAASGYSDEFKRKLEKIYFMVSYIDLSVLPKKDREFVLWSLKYFQEDYDSLFKNKPNPQ